MMLHEIHKYFLASSGVVTDTRKIKDNCLFVALKGENFNGNLFALEAIQKGAIYALVDDPVIARESNQMIFVEDTLKTLQELSRFHRKSLKVKIIALTGSNGKTTTKEILKSVLFQEYKTQATEGNLNNHIGVPLTLLSFHKDTEIGIVEMGANHGGEIKELCEIALPNYGLITNFGKAHLKGFGSLEGVIKAKTELYEYLVKNEGKLFINEDDPIQKEWKTKSKNHSFGEDLNATCVIEYLTKSGNPLKIKFQCEIINSKLNGFYNFTNLGAAIAIGKHFKISNENINFGVSAYSPSNNRSETITQGTNRITLDAYNANPTSMEVSIKAFNLNKNGVVILGDMFELGAYTDEEHQKTVMLLEETNLEEILIVGEAFFKTSSKDSRIQKFKTLDNIKEYLKKKSFNNKSILLKGSRGMALEKLLELL
jgi:UDP-N-acetylmuramoyl-tripeptide--D-alanyl-D-alanine ligase